MVDLLSLPIGIDNEIRLRYADLKQQLLTTVEHDLVHAHIAKIANIAHGKYCQHKVGRFLKSIDLSENQNKNAQAAAIRRKIVHIGNLYKKITLCLADENYSEEVVLNNELVRED